MALKGIEKPAAKALQGMLARLAFRSFWKPGADPPDLEFQIEEPSETWAVEVTELHQYFDHAGKAESRASVDRPLEKMCKRIQARVGELHNRRYLIIVNGPVHGTPLQAIEEAADHYVRSGKTEEVSLDKDGHVRMQAVLSPVHVSYMIGIEPHERGPGGQTLVADIRSNLSFALEQILAAKLPRLAQCTGVNRRVLLIWSEYFFAEPSLVREILREKETPKEQVDSVLLATDGDVHWVADPGKLYA